MRARVQQSEVQPRPDHARQLWVITPAEGEGITILFNRDRLPPCPPRAVFLGEHQRINADLVPGSWVLALRRCRPRSRRRLGLGAVIFDGSAWIHKTDVELVPQNLFLLGKRLPTRTCRRFSQARSPATSPLLGRHPARARDGRHRFHPNAEAGQAPVGGRMDSLAGCHPMSRCPTRSAGAKLQPLRSPATAR